MGDGEGLSVGGGREVSRMYGRAGKAWIVRQIIGTGQKRSDTFVTWADRALSGALYCAWMANCIRRATAKLATMQNPGKSLSLNAFVASIEVVY
jgi:hypothetical protein